MNKYIAETDELKRITAVWLKKRSSRGPSVFDPKRHIFDPSEPAEFIGAPREHIVSWLKSAQL